MGLTLRYHSLPGHNEANWICTVLTRANEVYKARDNCSFLELMHSTRNKSICLLSQTVKIEGFKLHE